MPSFLYRLYIVKNKIDRGKLIRAGKSLFVKKSELTFTDYRNSSALANVCSFALARVLGCSSSQHHENYQPVT